MLHLVGANTESLDNAQKIREDFRVVTAVKFQRLLVSAFGQTFTKNGNVLGRLNVTGDSS